MLVEEEGGTQGRLVLATGDNNIYIFDLETRRLVSGPSTASTLTATASTLTAIDSTSATVPTLTATASSSATVHIVTATA